MADAAIPGFTASPELEAKLNALDDNLNPITKDIIENEEDTTEETTEENEATDEVEKEQEVDESEEASNDNEESSDEEGYTIDDEAEDEVEEVVAKTPTETQTVDRSELTTEQQYILNNISPIKVRGSIGVDGEVQEYEVLSPEQLPQGFHYVDQREMSIANKNFALLENKALELQNQFRTQETNKAAQQFRELEDNADRADINQLQKEGELPRFKAAPDSKDFDKDPATVLIQEILDFKETLNNRYMEEYNAGRPYRHLGFQEAYAMYRRQNPKVSPEQQAEDNERKGLARRTTNTKSRSQPDRPKITRGMTSRDLDSYLENLDI
jgi:hypothetical protein